MSVSIDIPEGGRLPGWHGWTLTKESHLRAVALGLIEEDDAYYAYVGALCARYGIDVPEKVRVNAPWMN